MLFTNNYKTTEPMGVVNNPLSASIFFSSSGDNDGIPNPGIYWVDEDYDYWLNEFFENWISI